jgi:hypothetical protein
MTRTFAIGYASPELQQLYDQVREALERVVANLKVGERTKTYQDQVCAFFEERPDDWKSASPSVRGCSGLAGLVSQWAAVLAARSLRADLAR